MGVGSTMVGIGSTISGCQEHLGHHEWVLEAS